MYMAQEIKFLVLRNIHNLHLTENVIFEVFSMKHVSMEIQNKKIPSGKKHKDGHALEL